MINNTAGRPLSAPAPGPATWGGRFLVDAGDYLAMARLFQEHELWDLPFSSARDQGVVEGTLQQNLWTWTDAKLAERHGPRTVRPFHPTRHKIREIEAALAVIRPCKISPETLIAADERHRARRAEAERLAWQEKLAARRASA